MNALKITLKIKNPTATADELSLYDLRDEVLEAVNQFNDRFRDWSKRLVITQITKKALHLILVIETTWMAENISVREIRLFTQYLRNAKKWHLYTKEKNKMFETVEFSKIDHATIENLLSRLKVDEHLHLAQKSDTDFLEQSLIDDPVGVSIMTMNDEDIPVILDYLLKTKEKGKHSGQKKKDIDKIKSILSNWL